MLPSLSYARMLKATMTFVIVGLALDPVGRVQLASNKIKTFAVATADVEHILNLRVEYI